MNYCYHCKKELTKDNFDKKKNGNLYTRCKICRIKHNKNAKKKYVKRVNCFKHILCNNKNCKTCFAKSLMSLQDLTKNGYKKVDCWSIEKNNGLTTRNVFKCSKVKYWFKCDNKMFTRRCIL